MTEMLRIVGLCDDARRFESRQGLRNDTSATTLRLAPAARRFGIAPGAAQRRFGDDAGCVGLRDEASNRAEGGGLRIRNAWRGPGHSMNE